MGNLRGGEKSMKIVLGVTGSVAAKLTPRMVEDLKLAGHEVQVVATESSMYFWKEADIDVRIWRDKDEWFGDLYKKDQDIPHISIRGWTDAIVIAPLSANSLAKMANGMSDNLLTSLIRAWDFAKPVILAPAMNTHMWNHPVTSEHLTKLRSWYKKLIIVDPVSKRLACGDIGKGAMADTAEIIRSLKYHESY
ncbi:MAG: phosphopantothenoylcysteine decarboxylase [Candidatus Vogelbacteria bacterium]|nr:phosphopantothenoylcysteine decarboxylase [Candidatus Vogelbacteria bacterium]